MQKTALEVQGQQKPYVPTKKEKILLEALRNASNRTLGVYALCDLIDVSHDTYNRARKKPGFQQRCVAIGLEEWVASWPQVASTMAFQAKGGMFNQQKYISDTVLGKSENPINITGDKVIAILGGISNLSSNNSHQKDSGINQED